MSRTLVAVCGVTTAGVLPVFLAGALAVQMRGDVGYSVAQTGLVPMVFFLVCAAASAPSGRFAQRVGPVTAMRIATTASTACMALVAFVAGTFEALLAILAVGGLANAIGQPASNAMIAEAVPPERRGVGFAVKQIAIPLSNLVGGLAVPAIALTVGWRWAFVAGAAIGSLSLALVPRVVHDRTVERPPHPRLRGPIALLALGGGLGAVAGGSLGTYATSSGVSYGLDPGAAGLVLASGSAASLAVRLFAGHLGGRRTSGQLLGVAALMAAGSAGFVLMALRSLPAFVAGVPVAFALGWAWPGLFNFAISLRWPLSTAAATGLTQTGVYLGGSLGPPAFGWLVARTSFPAGWLAIAVVSILAALTIVAAERFGVAPRR